MWKLRLAEQKEREGIASGEYPEDWDLIAYRVKALAGWKCERCPAIHEIDGENGFVLTVHHLDGNKMNCELWNLAALCQRCHLRIQNSVIWYRFPVLYDWERFDWVSMESYPYWMAKHVKAYNVWAWLFDKPNIPISRIYEKDYSREWK